MPNYLIVRHDSVFDLVVVNKNREADTADDAIGAQAIEEEHPGKYSAIDLEDITTSIASLQTSANTAEAPFSDE